MNNNKIKKVVAILTGLLVFIFLAIVGFRIFGARASDQEPRDVVISNIQTNSVTISWYTAEETQGVIEYGTTPTALNFFAPEPSRAKNHSVDLTLLSPETTYYFQIRIGDRKYDNGGVPWSFTTKSVTETQTLQPTPTLSPTNPINPTDIPTPTPTPTSILSSPTPIDSVRVGNNSCGYSDCQTIKANLGKGCTTEDYFKCILNQTTPTSATSSAN